MVANRKVLCNKQYDLSHCTVFLSVANAAPDEYGDLDSKDRCTSSSYGQKRCYSVLIANQILAECMGLLIHEYGLNVLEHATFHFPDRLMSIRVHCRLTNKRSEVE